MIRFVHEFSAARVTPGLEESRHYCYPTHLLRAALAQPFPFRIAGRLPTRGDPRLFRGSALQSFSRAGEIPMRNDLSRRKFLERVGLTTAGVGLSLFPEMVEVHPTIALLPKRTLGRTNAKVSILAFGCGSR